MQNKQIGNKKIPPSKISHALRYDLSPKTIAAKLKKIEKIIKSVEGAKMSIKKFRGMRYL